MRGRLDYIDALRGFAITGVIVNHAASLAGLTGPARHLFDAGALGVQLFFLVSGFTIFLTLERAEGPSRMRDFFVKRLLRIVPVYWLGIALYTAVYGLGSRGWQPGPDLWHYPLHLTLTNLLHPETTSSVVPGGWSISCEVLFYLTVPLWFAFVRGWRSALVMLIASLLVGPLAIDALRPLLDPVFTPGVSLDQYWYRSFPNQMPFFSFGILLFYLQRTSAIAILRRPGANALALVAAALLTLRAFASGEHHIYGIAFFLAGLALSQISWGFVVNRASVFVGRISYSAYLFHFVALEAIHTALAPSFPVLLLLAGPATIALATVGFHFVEQPSTRLAKKLISGRTSRSAEPTDHGIALGNAVS